MILKAFEEHLFDPAPGFRCTAAGELDGKKQFIAQVRHIVGSPASKRALATAERLCGRVWPRLKRFLGLHDGVLLYRDRKSVAAGVQFVTVADWYRNTREMRATMVAMGMNPSDMPEWFHRGLAIANIPRSANYFVIDPQGRDAGKIFYCDHDAFDERPFASSFEDLLAKIIADPASFINECGCYARYRDGKTNIQWCPAEYLPDCRKRA